MTPSRHPLQTSSFDPLAMLRRNRGDANDVRSTKLRVLWLRKEVPEARVQTTLVTLDDNVVVMSATIALPDGGEGAGHAAIPISSDSDIAEMIETAELRAIGRALDILGYVVTDAQPSSPPPGTSRATSDTRNGDPSEPADSGDPAPTRAQRADGDSASSQQPSAPTTPPARDDRPSAPGHVQAIRALGKRDQREGPPAPTPITRGDQRGSRGDTPKPVQQPAERQEPASISHIGTDEDDDPELEDISWTAFWDWARSSYQFSSRGQLEELLGQSIAHKSPKMVRKLLLEHFDEQKSTDS